MKKLILVLSILATVKLQAQNVGIGTTTPAARLHVTDSAVLFSGPAGIPPLTTINPPAQGAGTRMFWFPSRGAFRSGYVDGLQWDRDSIGPLSFAAGYNTKAKGVFSTSIGRSTTASNAIATSMGFGTNASGEVSTSMGNSSAASGFVATSMGISTLASGDYSTAMGQSNYALGIASTATGGSTSANGSYSFSAGEQTFAKARGSFTAGLWNDNADNPDANSTAFTDRVFQIGNGTSGTRGNALTVLRNGFIGIGTTQPNAQLQFANNLDYRKMVIHERANNSNQYVGLGFISNEFVYQTSATAEDHVFYTATGPAGSRQLMRINGNGNVGIGTGDAEYRLDVNGRMRIRSGGDIINSAGIWLNNTANNASPAFIGMESDDGVGFYGNTTPNGWGLVMKIGTGNVGIGTSSPAAKLHVMSSILATGTITPSDSRYKKNIKPIGNALGKLQLLNGVTYTMNSDAFPQWQFDENMQYGLIAQNVEKVFPEMVKTIDSNGYKGVDYIKLIPVLIESIKEQQQQIEILKTENKEIKQLLSKSRL